jgi:hypothetical protein
VSGPSTADSGGVPWAGRTFAPTPFAGDDGTCPPALAVLLAGAAVDVAALVAALPGERLFVPVVALSGGTDERTGGDAGADMALPALRSPDGRSALPVFSSAASLSAWDAAARPVPVEARRIAVSAVQEGHQLLVLDPAGPATAVLPRPAVWALAQGRAWTPSWRDPQVAAAVAAAAGAVAGVRAVACERGARAELRVVLDLPGGLDAAAVEALTAQVSAALAESEVVAERVDSLELGLRSLGTARSSTAP